jgi:M6 family metalloprotease-like protein
LLILPVEFSDLPGVLSHQAIRESFGTLDGTTWRTLDQPVPVDGESYPSSSTVPCVGRTRGGSGDLVGEGFCTSVVACTSRTFIRATECVDPTGVCCMATGDVAGVERATVSSYLANVSNGMFSFESVSVVALDASGRLRVNAGAERVHTMMPRPAADYVGGDGGLWKKKRGLTTQDMVKDLAEVLDDADVDLSPWQDEDGRVHHVLVVEPSSDARGDPRQDAETSFIPVAFTLRKWDSGFRYFALASERQTLLPDGNYPGAGTAIHEFLHTFGIPDLYDTSYGSSGIGATGVMGKGLHVLKRYGPLSLTSAMREQLTWLTPAWLVRDTDEPATAFTYTLPPLSASGGAGANPAAVKVQIGRRGTVFLYLENRQSVGVDAGLMSQGLCPGLFVYRFDKDDYEDRLWNNDLNKAPRQGYAVVRRDGSLYGTGAALATCGDVVLGLGDSITRDGVTITVDGFGLVGQDRQLCAVRDTTRFDGNHEGARALDTVAAGARLATNWTAIAGIGVFHPLADGSFVPRAHVRACVDDAIVTVTMTGRVAGSRDRDDWLEDRPEAGTRDAATEAGTDGDSLDVGMVVAVVAGVAACLCLLCAAVFVVGCVVRRRSRTTKDRRGIASLASHGHSTGSRSRSRSRSNTKSYSRLVTA